MSNVGYASLQVIPSMKGVGAAVEKQLGATSAAAGAAGARTGGRFSSGFGGSIKSIAKTMGALFAAAAVGKFFKESIKGAEENLAIQRQTAQVIKTTGGAAGVTRAEVEKLSMKLAYQAGISDEAAQSTANMILTFKNIKNTGTDKIFDQTTAAAIDMSRAMKTDGKSAAVMLGKALNDPVKGLAALARVGVTFSAAQQKQVKAMVAAGNTLGAQKLILKEVNSEFGGAAAAIASPSERLKTMWGRLQVTIGTKLLPVIDKLVTFLTVKVVPALLKVADFIGRNSAIIKPLVAVVLAAVVVWKAWAKAQAVLNAVQNASPLARIVLLLAAVAAAVIYAYKHSETFRQIVHTAFSVVLAVVRSVADFFTVMVPAAFNAVVGAAQAVWNWIKANWPYLLSILIGPFGLVVGYVVKHFDQIVAFVSGIPGKLAAVARRMWSWIVDYFRIQWQIAVGLWSAAVSFVTGLPGRIGRAGAKMWDWIKTGLSAAWDWCVKKFEAILTWVGGLEAYISAAARGMWDGLLSAAKWIYNKIADAWNATVGKVSFHIPGWVPGVGGKGFSFPKMDHLARGAMTTGPIAAIIGDNPSGNEVVLPMDSPRTIATLAAALAKANGDAKAGGVYVAPGAVSVTEASDPVRTANAVVRRIALVGKV